MRLNPDAVITAAAATVVVALYGWLFYSHVTDRREYLIRLEWCKKHDGILINRSLCVDRKAVIGE